MPMKYFCDVCGDETKRNYVTERLKTTDTLDIGHEKCVEIKCEVMVAIDGTWNGGIICESCLREALSAKEV